LVKNKKILDFIGHLGYSGEEEWWNLVGLIVIWDVLILRKFATKINFNFHCKT